MTADPYAGPGGPTSVPAEVLRRAAAYPERPAIVDRQGTLRYRELVAAAATLAGALTRALSPSEVVAPHRPGAGTGITDGTGAVVAVLQPRTAAVVVAQLAAGFAGAAFLPLDPASPPARIARILADADCRVAVAADDLADRLPPGVSVVRAGREEHLRLPEPDDLAYLISTSGSTGRPKQVEVAHGSLWTVLDWYARFFGLGPGVRTAAFTGLAFDAALLDLWAPLIRGATVVLADEEVVRDPERIVETLRGVDHCFLSTPLTEQLLRSGAHTGRLRSLATGGDRLRLWPPAGFGAAVHNLYGPTEASILVTATGDLRRYADRSGPPPIGRPVAGARLTLAPGPRVGGRSPAGSRRGVGEGELLIAGPVLARGYRAAPAQTAAAFGTDPDGSTRHYRTGDICRRDASGELHFVGRVDGQVKIRGQRIELREVEGALLELPGVAQAAAGPVPRAGESLLVAWVVGPVTPDAVRAGLRDRLPAAMVPHTVHVRDALPLTSNGKLDRVALRADTERRWSAADAEPSGAATPACAELSAAAPPGGGDRIGAAPVDGTGASGVHPVDPVLAEAWRAVLGAAPRPEDDFFLVGGDSLLAVRLTAQVRQGLRIEVRAALLYEHRRFGDYLAAVRALCAAPVADSAGAPR
ncbi:non-ribosomal peptide synthetase [Micromonospora sp. GCM10011542]|uniref:non-ribosomal peptide synthetase n=1 Tax=Micromonospora sp. GCM10011542 TaxID=3317337 RepID=UPI00360721E7